MHGLRCRRWVSIPARTGNERTSSLYPTHRASILLVVPPASYRTRAYLDAARALGLKIHVASSGQHSLVPEISGGVRIDFDVPTEALRTLLSDPSLREVRAVVGTDDSTVEIAHQVAAGLGLRHNPSQSARAARRKDVARATLQRAGCNVPEFWRIDLRADLPAQLTTVHYPAVFKPLSMSGSRGVIRVDDENAAVAACRRIEQIVASQGSSDERRFVLAEHYLHGLEVALEGMLSDGNLRVLAVFDKPDPMHGPFFEETYYITPSRLSGHELAAVAAEVEKACLAYGLKQGPVHAELRMCGGRAWVLEVAARTIGGDCARLFQMGTGMSLEQMVLLNALGEDTCSPDFDGAAGVLMLPTPAAGVLRRVEGVLTARRIPGIEDVVIAVREGYELVPLPEGSSYLGFIFARGKTPAEVEVALRVAHACLNVVVAPAWRIHAGSKL